MVSLEIARSNARNERDTIEEIIVHTGQHYDPNLSSVFFDELQIPEPRYNLDVGSGHHGETTARMLAGVERVLLDDRPDQVLVYGDTNSTLAGALAATKLHIPVVHVEAGLRSYNKAMPEEVNRVLTDHVSTLLFCPTRVAVENLRREGVVEGVHHVGDVMYDAALAFSALAEERSTVLAELGLDRGAYCLATIHRAENTDDPKRLEDILEALAEVGRAVAPVVLPVHPRTARRVEEVGLGRLLEGRDALRAVPAVSFLDMVMLERNARTILTDSGGVQKEAYFHGVPCVTMRDETEWVETVEHGWNQVVGANRSAIVAAARRATGGARGAISDYGDGTSAAEVVALMRAAPRA
jgi:UDP-GlcNAc3NAcA epimerase